MQKYPIQYKGAQLHKRDIESLAPSQWLTSEAIYYGLLSETQIDEKVKIIDPSLATFILFNNDWDDLIDVKNELVGSYIITAINDAQKGQTGSHWGVLLYSDEQSILFDNTHNKQLIINGNNIASKICQIRYEDQQEESQSLTEN
ncbi:SUMO1 sentrin specific peptidase 8 [Paramecium bursaria]